MTSRPEKGIVFEVDMTGEGARPRSATPSRFRQNRDKPELSAQALEDKLQNAERRRKDNQVARMQRIRAKDVECKQITDAVSGVMDAGTGKTRATGSTQCRHHVIRTVQNGIDKMNRISGIDDNFFKHE